MMTKNQEAVFFAALFAGIILAPFAFIWALNTLFGAGIAYGFWEWLAMLVVGMFFNGRVVKNVNK